MKILCAARQMCRGVFSSAAFFALCIFSFFVAASLSSCNANASRESFTSALDGADALIEQGLMRDALAELKRTEKYTYDSWSRIGIYRRYMQLGETQRAEDVLKRGLKKNPDNAELSAVYAHLLLRQGRMRDALNVADCLKGTRFGAIYTEAFFVNFENAAAVSDTASLLNENYYSAFYDAYAGSGDSYWLRDAALVLLKDGDYAGAARIRPTDCDEAEDAYFWAVVCFDAREFTAAQGYAEKAYALYPTASVHSRHSVSLVEIASILSDAYVALAESDSAERVRRELFARLEENAAGVNIAGADAQADLPSLYVNSALFAETNGDDSECARLLTYAVDSWSDYAPALIAYGDFARRTNIPREEDAQERTLRDAGLATLGMAAYDAQAKVPVSDALSRMEQSLARINNPRLYVAMLSLRDKTDATRTAEQKIAVAWNELERNATLSDDGTERYPQEIFEYALDTFLSNGSVDDAWRLFRRVMIAKYDYGAAADFWRETLARMNDFTPHETEYAAYFAAYNRLADTALQLYENCVFGGAANANEKQISAEVSTPSCINMAMIYRSVGRTNDALSLYAATASRAVDARERAEAHYRMALIYAAQGQRQEALRSVNYALTLRPSFARAKLLRDRLSEQ